MICTTLSTLPWLLVTFTLSESLTLKVQDSITADCGQPVTLHCEVSSSMGGLSIKHMDWSQSQTYCSVDNEGHLTVQNSPGDFHCHYEEGHLSLHFHKWLPQQSKSPFMCKVRSNQGIRHDYTQVETREHWEGVETSWNSDFPTCIFRQVCPGGEVDWFQDSKKITNKSLITTNKEAGRSFTISSSLKTHSKGKEYKCRLKSVRSGQYLTSALIPSKSYARARAAAQGPMWIYLGLLLGFIVEEYYH